MRNHWRFVVGLAVALMAALAPTAAAETGQANGTLALPACATYINVYRTGPSIVRVPAQNSSGNVDCILAVGNQGNGVRQLQRSLNVCYGQGLTVDGVFGSATRSALIRVQRIVGTTADGGYGPNTRDAMRHQSNEVTTLCYRY